MQLRLLITAFFLLSGATALVYQVVWVRTIGLVVGHSVVVAAAVVAVYMAGLGLGARVAGARAGAAARPLAVYGVLEAGIGVFALASPALLSASGSLLGASLLLLLPTTAMGATLPLMTAWYARDDASLGRDMGWLYAVNTTGAVAGAAVAGFLLLPGLGQPRTIAVAAGVNLAVGGLAVVVGRARAHAPASPAASAPASAPPVALSVGARWVLLSFALSGGAALANQIAWNRSFVLFVGSTTYAFSLIVCAFIAGLALGGHVFAQWVDRVRDRVRLLAGVNVGIALTTALLIPLLGELPLLLIDPLAARADSFGRSQGLVFGVLFAVVVAPTFLMGGTYAVATRALAAGAEDAPAAVGRAYAWNTVGAVLGALLCGLVLLPALGIRNALWLAVGVNLAAAAVLLAPSRRVALLLPALALAGSLVTPAWNPRHMNLAPHMYATELAADPALREEFAEGGSLLFHEEGVGATVTVLQRASGARVLRIDGKTDASTERDRLYQGLVGVLPLLLSDGQEDTFLLGLGSGMSLAAALDLPVERATVVELLPEVVRGAEHFGELLGDPLEDPRTRLVLGDGRHRLAHTDQRFDAIGSNPTNLFVSGMSTLFTVEAFEAMRDALEPGGAVLVWVQGYLLRGDDFATVARTFQAVFPDATLWSGGPFDFYLVARTGDAPLTAAELDARIAALEGTEAAAWTGLTSAVDLQRHYLAGPETLRAIAGPGTVQRDADPFLEFSTPRALYARDGLLDVGALLARRERMPLAGAGPALLDARLESARAVDAALLGGDVATLRRALHGDPGHPAGRARLTHLLHAEAMDRARAQDFPGALARLELLTSIDPLALTSWRLRAELLRVTGRPDEAVAALVAARDAQPWNPYAHLALATLLEQTGDAAAAASARAEARRLDPALPELLAP